MNHNIMTLDDVPARSKEWSGRRVVLVGGCYDLLHYGHYAFFTRAKQEGDVLLVALESDEFIRTRKKREPVHTQQQRAEMLAAWSMIDGIILLPLMQSNADYEKLVRDVHPSVIAVTQGDPNLKYKQQHAEKVEAEVKEVIQLLDTFSTSSLIQYATILSD